MLQIRHPAAERTLLETLDGDALSYGDLEVAHDGAGPSMPKKDALKRARPQFGLMFQNYYLFPRCTALKSIADALVRVQRRSREERTRAFLSRLDEQTGRRRAHPGAVRYPVREQVREGGEVSDGRAIGRVRESA